VSRTERQTVYRTELAGIPLARRGKVRDVYDLGDSLLLVATDRLSAFDVVFAEPVPDKGRVLNQLSAFWFDRTQRIVLNQVLATDFDSFPELLDEFREQLAGRSMIVRKLRMFPVECVARGYLAGSAWREYRETGAVCGVKLPAGLREAEQLEEPIFTPATKAETGHDLNIPFEEVVALVGEETAEALRETTLKLYRSAADYASRRGILVADTKFEFGTDEEGRLYAADEMLTPDSSRFWPADRYEPGRSPPSLDKQYVRDYLESVGWDKSPPPPSLPPEVIEGTRQRYLEIFRLLTGRDPD
jgi:phosphoribosylaminoimidazole-succinocarboxamide synthase